MPSRLTWFLLNLLQFFSVELSPQRPTVTQGSSPPSPAGLSLGEALKAQEPSQVGRGLGLGAAPGATGPQTVAGFSEPNETPNPK